MALARSVRLNPPPARTGGLLTQSLPLPSGWERGGIAFASTGCLEPFVVGECPTGPSVKAGQRPGPVRTFVPVTIGAAIECSTLGGELYPAGDVVDQTLEHALYEELLLGSASKRDDPDDVGNPTVGGSLTDDLGDLTDVVQAFGCVEQAALLRVSNRPVWLHTSVAALTAAAAAGVVWRDGTRWRTAHGSTVLSTPLLDAAAIGVGSATSDAVVATLPVYAGRGQRARMADTDRALNTTTEVVEDVALAVFDPCVVVSAGTGVTCPVGTVPLGGTPIGDGPPGDDEPDDDPDDGGVPEQCDDQPNSAATKDDLVGWLDDVGIGIDPAVLVSLTKAELRDLIGAVCDDDTDAQALVTLMLYDEGAT